MNRVRITTRVMRVFAAIIAGVAVTWIGVYSYSFIARTNLRAMPEVPWGAVLAIVLLWLYWRWLGGSGWPSRTAALRARLLRANPVDSSTIPATVAACVAGLVFVLAAMTFALRLTDLPADAFRVLPDDHSIPLWTTAPLLFMLSLVAGVCEEAGIRGYAQKAIEENASPFLAIATTALIFTLLHANKAWFLEQAVPMFIAAMWYGYLTFVVQSIYPMILVHTLLDVVLFTRYEIMRAPLPAAISVTGLSPVFWINLLIAVVAGAATFLLTFRMDRHRYAHRPVTTPVRRSHTTLGGAPDIR